MRQGRSRAARAQRSFVASSVGLVLGALLVCAPARAQGARPVPDTSDGIHVFNDQIHPGLTQAQVNFCARRYAGTQKLTLADASRLRAVNPDFLVLHYRLGMGLGY